MHALTELAAVMEEEVRIGEELLRNLAAQKEAILSWNSSALLARVEEKEVLIRRLGEIEERRREIMTPLCPSPGPDLSLRELLAQLSLQDRQSLGQEELRAKSKNPALSPGPLALSHSAQDRLGHLQHHAREIYSRLRQEEKRLISLMENLLGHLREALSPLSHSPVHLYGKKGIPTLPRPRSGLMQGKI